MNEVLLTVERSIAMITINRPEQRNALNPAVLAGLRRSLRAAIDNPAAQVIAITGSGDKVFCAGADLKASVSQSGDTAGKHFGRGEYRELLLDILQCPKPTVALARGHVMAGGIGIFLACDLTLACADVHFSTPEIHVGMFPMMVLALLFRHVGRKQGTEMIFLGERVSASAALEYGIVNHLFARAEFEARAEEFLAKLAEKSVTILGLGKKAMRAVEGIKLPESLEYLESALEELMATEDSKEGIRAFVEKRKPSWKN